MVLGLPIELDAVAGGNVRARADEEVVEGVQALTVVEAGLGHRHRLQRRVPGHRPCHPLAGLFDAEGDQDAVHALGV